MVYVFVEQAATEIRKNGKIWGRQHWLVVLLGAEQKSIEGI